MNTYPGASTPISTPQQDQTYADYTQYMASPGGCATCAHEVPDTYGYPMGVGGTGASTGAMQPAGSATGTPAQPQQSGQAAGQSMPGGMAGASTAPIMPSTQPAPITTQTVLYLNGYLRTQIGNKVTVTFLIGTGTQVDRTGTLLAVGANYLVLNEVETDDIVICDFYTIKFVRVYF